MKHIVCIGSPNSPSHARTTPAHGVLAYTFIRNMLHFFPPPPPPPPYPTPRDWCISRQLWWGHRVPAYYVTVGGAPPFPDNDTGEKNWVVARSEAEALELASKRFGQPKEKLHLAQGGALCVCVCVCACVRACVCVCACVCESRTA